MTGSEKEALEVSLKYNGCTPVVAAMNKADDAMKLKIKNDVFELVDQKYPDKKAALDYGAVIVCGEK